jgi:predicted transcriptional regulator YheO
MYDSREHAVTAIAGVLGVSRATIYSELDLATAEDIPAQQSS